MTLVWQRFNPRTPAGCDDSGLSGLATKRRFQSTHPCGVRHMYFVIAQHLLGVSIHAPLRGATPLA